MKTSSRAAAGMMVLMIALLPAALPAVEPARKTEPVKPPWQRYLQGEDAKRAAEQDKKLAEFLTAGQFREASKAAEALVELRTTVQGADHWQAVDARWVLNALRCVVNASREDQKSFSDALGTEAKARSLMAQGRYAESQPLFGQILIIDRKVLGEESPRTALDYNNLAYNLHFQGKYREAEEGFRKAWAIRYRVLGEEHPATARSFNNILYTQQVQGKYGEIEQGLRNTLTIRRKVLGETNPETADSYNNLAINLQTQGKYQEADENYRKALDIHLKRRNVQEPEIAKSYNNLASNLRDQGKYPEAEERFRKALDIFRKSLGEEHPDTASAYHNLAAVQQAQGKYLEAEKGYRKAMEIRLKMLGEAHANTILSYINLAANLSARGNYDDAESYLRRAADSFAKVRLQIAATGLERAAFASKRSPLAGLAAVLARNGKPDEAWQRFEESLGRGTWDDLTARLRRPQAERDKQAQITARIDRLSQLIAKTNTVKLTNEQSKQRDEWLSQLRQAYDELAAFIQQLENKYGPIAGQVFTGAQIQAELPADAALIAWLDIPGLPKAADPNGEHWAILLRSAGDPIWVRLRGSGDKNAWTDADTKLPGLLREAVQSPRGIWQPLAERLRRQRLDPLAQHLQGVRRLIVLPSNALPGVPVEVIADGYTVSYAHSGTMYAHLRQLRQQHPLTSKGLFVLADPAFDSPKEKEKPQPLPPGGDDGNWPRLPGTLIEAISLQSLFDKDTPVQMLLASDASEQRLNDLAKSGELGKYRYIHLATHGEVNDAFPLRSAVILARDHLPDDKQLSELLVSGQPIPDGRLEAEEALRRWNLHADLVTLSACQTALGKYERGEGFVGFAQALILCGTRSVCLSLWKVNDVATALLMERFYQNLLGKRADLNAPMPKAAALAEAKTWLRTLSHKEAEKLATALTEGDSRGKPTSKRPPMEMPPASAKAKPGDCPFAHPRYWAAFILTGDPE